METCAISASSASPSDDAVALAREGEGAETEGAVAAEGVTREAAATDGVARAGVAREDEEEDEEEEARAAALGTALGVSSMDKRMASASARSSSSALCPQAPVD